MIHVAADKPLGLRGRLTILRLMLFGPPEIQDLDVRGAFRVLVFGRTAKLKKTNDPS